MSQQISNTNQEFVSLTMNSYQRIYDHLGVGAARRTFYNAVSEYKNNGLKKESEQNLRFIYLKYEKTYNTTPRNWTWTGLNRLDANCMDVDDDKDSNNNNICIGIIIQQIWKYINDALECLLNTGTAKLMNYNNFMLELQSKYKILLERENILITDLINIFEKCVDDDMIAINCNDKLIGFRDRIFTVNHTLTSLCEYIKLFESKIKVKIVEFGGDLKEYQCTICPISGNIGLYDKDNKNNKVFSIKTIFTSSSNIISNNKLRIKSKKCFNKILNLTIYDEKEKKVKKCKLFEMTLYTKPSFHKIIINVYDYELFVWGHDESH